MRRAEAGEASDRWHHHHLDCANPVQENEGCARLAVVGPRPAAAHRRINAMTQGAAKVTAWHASDRESFTVSTTPHFNTLRSPRAMMNR
jgi:hypothetical protein